MTKIDTGNPLSTSHSLIWKLKQRHEGAWERMVVLYTPLVYHWCRRSQLTPEESEDVTQDVFRTVSESIDRFRRDRESDTFRGWLRTVFKSRVVDHIRRHGGQPSARGGTDALLWLENSPEEGLGECDPATQALFRRVLDLIQGEFSDAAWQAFWMTTAEELPARDVAEQLSMTPGAVRQAKYRILRRVREEIGDVE
jgi:RNA polymerase sigma-70 factor (ECF subfamily)